MEIVLRRGSDRCVGRENLDAGMVVADSELVLGADHSERLYATNLGLLDLEVSREHGSDAGEENFLAGGHVRSAADNGQRLAGAVIDFRDMKMVGVRMRLALKHLGDYDSRESARNLLLFLNSVNLDSYSCHSVRDLLRSKIGFKIIL